MLGAMASACGSPSAIRTQSHTAPVDRLVSTLAASQHGVVARGQLRALGLTESGITRRVDAGRLHRVHRGVYADGHPALGARGRWMAAVLACGPEAALSHASAAALWGLRPSAATEIAVTVPANVTRTVAGVRVHRARSLGAADVAAHHDIRVTSPARTILDLAATFPPRAIERLLQSPRTRA
jgi:predicted transcriptional regulator of viral defense system